MEGYARRPNLAVSSTLQQREGQWQEGYVPQADGIRAPVLYLSGWSYHLRVVYLLWLCFASI
jgi:hypothetical protein